MTSDAEWFLSDNEVTKRHESLDGKYLGDADADDLIALVMDIDADRAALLERGRRLAQEYQWMRREIERVGRALFTNSEGHNTGTEEDLMAVGQFVEGLVETLDELAEAQDEAG